MTDAKAGTTFIPETPPELLAEDDDLGGAALVIKRVDVADDKFTESQTFYIGRRVVRTPEGDLAVISWHARAAKEWMLARSDDPGDVLLRRDLRCDGRKVTGYFDDIKAPRHTDVGADIPGEAEEPQWLDLEDFLLEDLRRARGGQMRDIVETIQREQFILVSDERKSLLVVQGGPGTGKTAVGLHRVSWLLFNNVFKASDVLVVGPHQGFLKYVGQVLPQLGTRGVTSIELARLWDGEARGSDNLEARRIKSSSKMAEVLRRAVDNLANPKALESAAARTIQVGPRPVTLPSSFIRFTGTEGVRLPYLVRRRQFTDRVVDHLLRAGGAAGKRSRDEPGARKQVEQRRDVMRMVSRVFPSVSAEELLRSLLRGRQALRAAAAGVLSEEEQQAIVRTPAAKVSQEAWSPEDLVCLEEIRFLMTGETSVRWQHVVVDEAQDLTPMQARSLARRCPSGSMTLLGDLAQATGVHRYAGWQELAGQLGGQSGGHLAELTIGYRVPREVMDFAAPLAAVLAPDTTFPRSVRPPADDEVLRIIRTDPSRLVAEAIERVSTLSGTDGKRGRSVAFILPDDDPGMLRSAQAGIAAEQLESVIQVRTAGQIKGLEFDHVVVLEPAAIAAQEWAGLHGLYVAITRCTQTLTILHFPFGPAADRSHWHVRGV
ncbi:HelD family protein [Actinomadura monticuli]|uniref:AAA family ATPase n=1 Tax=Actinomadura monticuli TaxID=3097367 RepID=A0ABV4QES8_9ACTN